MYKIHSSQQKEWQYLLNRRDKNNLPHSLLITGEQGAGKKTFALAFAELLLCDKKGVAASCGQCRSCRLLQAESHPDLMVIQPEADSRIIKIEQIRNVIDMLSQKAHQGGYQIIIINPAHAMNAAASNALLKTLEEPQGDVMLMLLTNQPSNLLATIRSRCQRIAFNICIEQKDEFALYDKFEALLNKKMNPVEFAEKCKDIDLQVIIKYLQIWLLDLIKKQTHRKLFNCFDQLIEYNKYINNNLNKTLTLENIGFKINNAG